jgi:hypothetical protein
MAIMYTRLRHSAARVAAAAGAVLLSAAIVAAQAPNRPNTPVDLPSGPAKPGFDLARFSNAGNGWFETFHVGQADLLRDALKAGKVADDTRLLVTDVASGRLALVTDQMAFHHLAQGSAGGKDWLVTF